MMTAALKHHHDDDDNCSPKTSPQQRLLVQGEDSSTREHALTAGHDRVEGTAEGILNGLQAAERCRLLNTWWCWAWRCWRWGGLWWDWWVDLWPHDAATAAVQSGNRATTIYYITRGRYCMWNKLYYERLTLHMELIILLEAWNRLYY